MAEDLRGLYFGGSKLVDHSRPVVRDFAYLQDDDASAEEDENEDDFQYPTAPAFGQPAEDLLGASKKRRHSHVRVGGGVSAVPKPIDINYDSDDARIITLKKQGHSDDFVCERLKEEGRMIYRPKTIASRWIRYKKFLQDNEDQRLDDESHDWCSFEDDTLLDCVSATKEKYEQEVEALKQARFLTVAADVEQRLGERKFSAKACRERFEGFEAGTALPPLDEDPDQDARRMLRESRIAEVYRIREQEAANASATQSASKQHREQKLDQAREEGKARQEVQREREDAKAAKQRKRDTVKAVAKEHREAREGFLASERRKAEEKKQEEQKVDLMYHHLTGHRLNGKRSRRHSKGASPEPGIPVRKHVLRLASGRADDEEDEVGAGHNSEADEEEESSLDLNDDLEPSASEDSSVEEVMPNRSTTVNEQTLLNPRSILTDAELDVLLFERNAGRRGRRESHAQAVARVAAIDDALPMKELDKLLGDGLPGAMTKENKVHLLQVRDAQKCQAGTRGVTSKSMAFKKGYDGYKGKFRALLEKRD